MISNQKSSTGVSPFQPQVGVITNFEPARQSDKQICLVPAYNFNKLEILNEYPLLSSYGITTIPALFLIDKNGMLANMVKDEQGGVNALANCLLKGKFNSETNVNGNTVNAVRGTVINKIQTTQEELRKGKVQE